MHSYFCVIKIVLIFVFHFQNFDIFFRDGRNEFFKFEISQKINVFNFFRCTKRILTILMKIFKSQKLQKERKIEKITKKKIYMQEVLRKFQMKLRDFRTFEVVFKIF